ncbi:MAG: NAD(P)H-dependent glycerol-3-phosphate dehydrogenase [Saprospiraceae bacterium]|nr:NAD(P)H-dependent glycerol-3-phosphate dehydrogenase [Saprospiraceae bacterium]MBP6568785.1 NAD(P)H-dependent glycerol-3-phosphate dehydrogenase [Saprospiraceae bacterium]
MKTVGIIGAGSFGITLVKILSRNVNVIIYSRNESVVKDINEKHIHMGNELRLNVKATTYIKEITKGCELLFAVVPSSNFRQMMKDFCPFLKPSHIMIQCTKGLDVSRICEEDWLNLNFKRDDVCTMTEVIRQESNVIRVGCLSGPNLAKEILSGQPAATVIASEFDEVIKLGQTVLSSKKFFAFGSHDLKAAEIAGAFKNIIAVASGILAGMGMGKNMQSLLITRGLREMISFGTSMGTSGAAYLGVAGIGDLIATATSEDSRNYTFGKRFASGEDFNHIMATSSEVVEGVRTLKIINQLAKNEKLNLPIVQVLYKVVYEGFDIQRGLEFLMNDSYAVDVDFL